LIAQHDHSFALFAMQHIALLATSFIGLYEDAFDTALFILFAHVGFALNESH
jgi:hypothetical protein